MINHSLFFGAYDLVIKLELDILFVIGFWAIALYLDIIVGIHKLYLLYLKTFFKGDFLSFL